LAPRLLAELGEDQERFQDVNRFQKLAGTASVLKQSGMGTRPPEEEEVIRPGRHG